MKWTKKRSAQAHAAKQRRRIERSPFRDPELVRVPRGEYLGILQWHDASGQVRRWVIRQGSRANNITVKALIHNQPDAIQQRTWTWMLHGLCKLLSIPRRIVRACEEVG